MLSLTLAANLALPRPEAVLAPFSIKTEPPPYAGDHDGQWFPDGDLVELCKGSVPSRGGDVCCPITCLDMTTGEPRCGGDACKDRHGGAKHCCILEIEITHNMCEKNTDHTCIMPTKCEQDRCLLHCPLNPACSIIWKNRGLDYLAMRDKLGFSTSLNETDSSF